MKLMAILFFSMTAAGAGLLAISMEGNVQSADFVFVSGHEVDTLDPQAASWATDFRALELMFEPPLTVNTKTMALEPATVERWEVSDDKLTYTLHIRPTARWSNGDPVTSHDFIYAWQRAMIPDYASAYFSLLMHIKGAREFFDLRNADKAAYLKTPTAESDDDAAATTAEVIQAGWVTEIFSQFGKDAVAEARAKREELDRALVSYGGTPGRKDEATAQALYRKMLADFDRLVGLKAVDDRTIAITLEQNTPYFLELLAFPTYAPVHKASVDATISLDAATGGIVNKAGYFTDPQQVITNGPYYLAKLRFKSHSLYKANPYYWDRANMGNESIAQVIIEDPMTAMIMYNRGQVHWLPDIPTTSSLAADLVGQAKAGHRNDVITLGWAGTFFYHFNCKPEHEGRPNPMADVRVRRALSMAIDRRHIVENITRLHQPIAMTMTPVGSIPGYEPPVELGCRYDPEAARKLLAEAGYPGGRGFPQNLKIFYNTGSDAEKVPQVIQQAWERELGIKLSLEGVEKNRFMDLRRKTQFAVARGGWLGDYRDPTTFLEQHVTADGHNNSAYSNPEYDRYYHEAARELDPKKRYELLLEAERILTYDQPIAPIFQYINLHVYDPAIVENMNPNLWNYRRLSEVKVNKKQK